MNRIYFTGGPMDGLVIEGVDRLVAEVEFRLDKHTPDPNWRNPYGIYEDEGSFLYVRDMIENTKNGQSSRMVFDGKVSP